MNIRRFLVLLLILATACVPAQPQATVAPTMAPTHTALPTQTPLPPTSTPLPTETPTPVPTNTSVPTATPNATATAAAQATQQAEEQIAQIKKDLEPFGIAIDKGNLVYFDKNGSNLHLTTYGEIQNDPMGKDLNLSNFIVKVDITLESKTGLAGCGLIYRSEDDLEKGAQYQFATLRLSGAPAWDIEYWNYGRWDHTVTGRWKFNNAMDDENGATNTYILVIQGSKMTVYANGTRMGTYESTKRTAGMIAYLAWQESGETTCGFSNTWVWALPEE